MSKNGKKKVMIVESPAKIKKISSFLDKDWVVIASYGHFRDLDAKKLSIDVNDNFKPNYSVSESKKNVLHDLKYHQKNAESIWLASDYDREGESIAWHISDELKLNSSNRKRIVFTSITKKAILDAIKAPSDIDMNMFYSQQARRILDRLIGYLVSPVLWKHIQSSNKKKISLSAGRVQSVVLRLIVEREIEISKFQSNKYFKSNGIFITPKNEKLFCELDYNFEEKDQIVNFLEDCKTASFKICEVRVNKTTRKPSPPFITSTLQQEASLKLRMSPKSTMSTAQKLYEAGLITYMRPDSFTLSPDALAQIENKISLDFGDNYVNITHYDNKSKNSQEAHEACRPCDIEVDEISDDLNISNEGKKLYRLIWERTIASQMSPAKVEILTNKITVEGHKHKFVSKSEKILFDGFLKLKMKEEDNDSEEDDNVKNNVIKHKPSKGDELKYQEINSTEKYSKPPHARFTEASLVKKLDEMGIGRPSTYSSMISIIQDRNYAEKKDKEGEEKEIHTLKLKANNLDIKTGKTKVGGDKKKLFPTNIGNIVTEFLTKHFSEIMDYKLTATIEQHLDDIANGTKVWHDVVKHFYDLFYPVVEKMGDSSFLEKDNYKRLLGTDPKTGQEIYTYIGKFGPLVQLKGVDGDHKFAPLNDINIKDITLEQALDLLAFPKKIGDLNGIDIILQTGKYGFYLKYNKKNFSVSNSDISLKDAKEIIKNGGEAKKSNLIKQLNDIIAIKDGKYGPYISYKNGKLNVKLYGKKNIEDYTLEDCIVLINRKKQKDKGKK